MPTSRDFAHLPVHELIRRFARFRTEGDDRVDAVWEALVVKTFDRVRQSVRSFTFPGGGRLREAQRDDAVQEAYLRVKAMAGTFEGSSEGEYFAALAKCVWYACMDFGRGELSYEKKLRGSLDEPAFDEGDRGRYDEALEQEARQRAQAGLDRLEEEARRQRDHDLVAWGVSQVTNDSYREVLELTFLEKLDGDAIAAKLDIKTPNVYQRRRRAIEKLEEVLRDRRS